MNRRALLAAASAAIVAGCKPKAASDGKTVKFIMSDLSFTTEWEPILAAEMVKRGFKLDWLVVNDIILPNEMVDSGQADANFFQHEAYFDQFVKDHDLHNTVRGFYTEFVPSGLYSKTYKSLAALPDGASIGVPVDPANNGRALFMLRDHGLLTLRPDVPVTHASMHDITGNPHNLRFLQVDQQMLVRTYQDVDVVFLFAIYAKLAGLDPVRDALALETYTTETKPYSSVVAIRRDLVRSPKIMALQAAFASAAVKAFFREKYGKSLIFLDDQNQ